MLLKLSNLKLEHADTCQLKEGAQLFRSKPNLLLNIKFNLCFILYMTDTCQLLEKLYLLTLTQTHT